MKERGEYEGGDREAYLLRLAMDLSDGNPIDWDAEAKSHPELLPALKNGEMLAYFSSLRDAQSPDSQASTPSMPGAGHRTAKLEELPRTWGHLEILEKIGEGHFGVVYRAHDTKLDIDVALKLLRSNDCSKERGRFVDEARRLAKVQHPNVVVVHGADEHDGRVGLWTDLLVGQTLEDHLQQVGIFSARFAALIGMDLCRALAAVHQEGLVHNDVKTTNVMQLEKNARNVLMDFGCVREVAPLTRTGKHLYGTPVYIAPEILAGNGRASAASDIYALGVLLYRLVSRAFPVDGDSFDAIVEMHERRQSVRLLDRRPDLPPRFVAAVESALEPDPKRRAPSAGVLERALQEALAETSGSGLEHTNIGERHSRLHWWQVAGAVAVLAGLVAILLFQGPGGGPPRAEVSLFRGGEKLEPLHPGATLQPGDKVFLEIHSPKEVYCYVLNAATNKPAAVNLLFPTDLNVTNPLARGTRYKLPGQDAGSQGFWELSTPGGEETIMAIVSRKRLRQLEMQFPTFNQVFFHRDVAHLEVGNAPGLREFGVITVEPNPNGGSRLAQIAENIEVSEGNDVWIWRMTMEGPASVEEDSTALDLKTSANGGSGP